MAEAARKKADERVESEGLYPNDHARMLVELLRAGGVELTRRWVAALLLVPEGERAAVVESVRRRIVEEYGGDEVMLDVAEEPVQREGYVEQVVRTYSRKK